jgi:glycosyltransferase involved in cell wall biosynthesis
MDVVGIEFSSADQVYSWGLAEGGGFPRLTLFEDSDVATKFPAEVAQRLYMALEKVGPDVVAVPGWSEPGALIAISWCLGSGVPIIMMSDSTVIDAPRRAWGEWAKRRILRLCGAALVAGTPHAAYLTGLGVGPERIFLGYDVVDNEHFANVADSSRLNDSHLRKKYSLPKRYFLASSRFVGKKNLFMLVEAYARYRQDAGDGARGLVILGDGDLRASLVEQISALGLREAVRLPGFMQYDDLPLYYGLAEAFVHASTVEQWGLVVNEAMAAGLPVILSERCGCASDLVEHEGNGYLFDPLDVAGLSNLIGRMAFDGHDREAMGRRSREIIANWNLDRFAHGLGAAARAALTVPRPRASWLDRLLLHVLARRRAFGSRSRPAG